MLIIIFNAFFVFPIVFPLGFLEHTKSRFAVSKIRQQVKGDIRLSKILILIVKIPQILYLSFLALCIIFLGIFLSDVIMEYIMLSVQGLPYTILGNHPFFVFSVLLIVTLMMILHAYQSEASMRYNVGFRFISGEELNLSESLEIAKMYLLLSRERLMKSPRSGTRLLRYSLRKINTSFREVNLLEILELPVAEHMLDVISKLHPRAFCNKLVKFVDRLLSAIEKGEHGKVAIIISKFNSDKELVYTRKFKAPKKAFSGIFKLIGSYILGIILVIVTLFHKPIGEYITSNWPGFLFVVFFVVIVPLASILSVNVLRYASREGQMVLDLLHKPRRS